jgi:ethanolamine utilization protein EutQ (cupin superfamily)
MAQLIESPTRIVAAGEPPKQIDEIVGRVNSGTSGFSVAHMRSPAGWAEPAQVPEFAEVTYVLAGWVKVEHEGGVLVVRAGQAVLTQPGERVRYSTPEGAEYVAVCVPAFSPTTVHREE